MRKLLEQFNNFSRREQRGILVLLTGILLVVLYGSFFNSTSKESNLNSTLLDKQQNSVVTYQQFLATVQEKEKKQKEVWNHDNDDKQRVNMLTPQPFNPNTADSVILRQIGLPQWMIRNILKYRKAGGYFRKAEDFKKVYGLTAEQYATLAPYIHIPQKDTIHQAPPKLIIKHEDSIKPKEEKYPIGTIVDINLADTTTLKKIPGIGSSIARLIIGYRQRLGGFYKLEQLKEINIDHQKLTDWFKIAPETIQPINVNKASIERLFRHPYINIKQAKAIIDLRKKMGKLNSLKDFALLEEFNNEDLERLKYYIYFE